MTDEDAKLITAAAERLFKANKAGLLMAADLCVSKCGTDVPRLMAMAQKTAFYLGVAAAMHAVEQALRSDKTESPQSSPLKPQE